MCKPFALCCIPSADCITLENEILGGYFLPVDHAGTWLVSTLEEVSVCTKELLETLLLSGSAGFKAWWEACGRTRGLHSTY